MTESAPSIDTVRALRDQLGGRIVRTPLIRCAGIEDALGGDTAVYGKLEFLQRTGTFKARGALAQVLSLDDEEKTRGITAVSAGNHAIAAAYAAHSCGVSAKVVMIATANPYRLAACRAWGADVVMAANAHEAFERVEEIVATEGRTLVHPFEGPAVAAGTGTLGLEMTEQLPEFEAVIVSIGGGGLIGGVAAAIRQLKPDVEIHGVETPGADSMSRSLAAGEPVSLDKVDTIADSLGAPFALPYSFELCQRFVAQVVLVSADELRQNMGFLFSHLHIAVEPACAAPVAALRGPLREVMRGKRVLLLFCGSNIDWHSWQTLAEFETP